jgi:exosortase A
MDAERIAVGRRVQGESRAAVLAPATAAAVVVCTLLVVFALHAATLRSMAEVWGSSGTFTHGFLVIPACLWLIWRQRDQLHLAPASPQPRLLLLVAIGGAAWMLGDLSASQSVTHFALMFVAIAVVLAVFGSDWGRRLTFPLALLIFAVPFGEAFVPVLMDWTADFTVAALRFSGVPVLREGNELTIPTGRWSVVEACSGARYLVASVAVGTVYAWIVYRSPLRRAAFIAAATAVPIVANWLRAYLIVMLGHLSSNELAVGVDHFVYGWVFFGIVIFVLFAAGLRWREDGPAGSAGTPMPAPPTIHRVSLPVAVVALVLVAAWPVASTLLKAAGDQRQVDPVPAEALPEWTEAQGAAVDWRPQLERPRARTEQSFTREGTSVTLHIGYFRNQGQGSELVNWQHRLTAGDSDGWLPLERSTVDLSLPAGPRAVHSVLMRGPDRRQLRVWQWYWLGGRTTTSDTVAKADLAFDRLLMRSDTSAWVAIASEHDPQRPGRSEAALLEFMSAMNGQIAAALAQTAGR